jgi:hypothetical protein
MVVVVVVEEEKHAASIMNVGYNVGQALRTKEGTNKQPLRSRLL